jgi:hypothetical protein
VDAFSTSQRVYAAFDVIKPLEIYDKLNAMPDLNARLAWSDAKVGMEVDIFPSTGSVTAVSVSAIGVIKSITPGDNWIVPVGISDANQKQRKISSKEQTLLVTLKQVFAAGLKVPYFTRGTEKRGLTLGALAQVHHEEFAVLLSARNLSEHLPKRSKHSKSMPFGPRRVAQKYQSRPLDSTGTSSVEGQLLDLKEVGYKKRASNQPVRNPYAKKRTSVKRPSSNQPVRNPYAKKRTSVSEASSKNQQSIQNPYAKKKRTVKKPVLESEASSNESRASTAPAPTTAPTGTVENVVDTDESELMEDVLDATIADSENDGFDYEGLDLNEQDLLWVSALLGTDSSFQDICGINGMR